MNYTYDDFKKDAINGWLDGLDSSQFLDIPKKVEALYPSLGKVGECAEYCKRDVEATKVAYDRLFACHYHLPAVNVKKAIFNNPATIIYWNDGSKTVVKCQSGDTYDPEKGFVMAYLKKLLGNDNTFNKEITKWVKYDEPSVEVNKQLTTEQLMRMDGQKVYCTSLWEDGTKENFVCDERAWHTVDVKNKKLTDVDGNWYAIEDSNTPFGFRAYLRDPRTTDK